VGASLISQMSGSTNATPHNPSSAHNASAVAMFFRKIAPIFPVFHQPCVASALGTA